MKRTLFVLAAVVLFISAARAQGVETITPQKALEMSAAERTFLVDVRSVAEYVLVGHPPMAWNIPLSFWSETEASFVPNEGFLDDLKSHFKTDDVLIFICRGGGRSRRAAQTAATAGFIRIFNVGEGFEGAKDEKGHFVVGGWKSAGLPYTHDIDPQRAYRPSSAK